MFAWFSCHENHFFLSGLPLMLVMARIWRKQLESGPEGDADEGKVSLSTP
jgi:hypothetical protein